jgi:hypothetical protein
MNMVVDAVKSIFCNDIYATSRAHQLPLILCCSAKTLLNLPLDTWQQGKVHKFFDGASPVFRARVLKGQPKGGIPDWVQNQAMNWAYSYAVATGLHQQAKTRKRIITF